MRQEITLGHKNRPTNCTLWQHGQNQRVLIIAPAMGVFRSFYAGIAEYFFQQSYNVIALDYYGMADKTVSSDNPSPRMADWGKVDIQAAIRYAGANFTGLPIFFLGHSVGGQVFPLAPDSHKVTAACMVAAQNASKTHWNGKERWALNIFWHLTIPFCTRILGKLPGVAYGGKHALHKEVAREWGRWGRSKEGLLSIHPEARAKYRRLSLPVKFISFYDDKLLAPKEAVAALAASYGSERKRHEHILPADTKGKGPGHFKFFTREFEFLWPRLTDWFDRALSIPAESHVRKESKE